MVWSFSNTGFPKFRVFFIIIIFLWSGCFQISGFYVFVWFGEKLEMRILIFWVVSLMG